MSSTDTTAIRIDVGHQLVSGSLVNGYAWYYIVGGVKLFTPAPNAFRTLLECQNCTITHLEGGTLTETGLEFYNALAEAPFICFNKPCQSFRIWTARPNTHIAAQVAEKWGLVDRTEREAMIAAHLDVFRRFIGEDIIIGRAVAHS